MFRHLFGYRLKCIVRDVGLLFWTIIYPLIMATFFFFAFGHLMKEDGSFTPIRTAVVNSAAYRESGFRHVLQELSRSGKSKLLDLTVVDEKAATKMLEQGDVDGVIVMGTRTELRVRQSGLGQSILKVILDEYAQTSSTAGQILRRNPGAGAELFAALEKRTGYTVQTSFSRASPNVFLNYFYALIAMTCMMGAHWGLKNTTHTQANLSDQALRRSVAPTHKLAVVLSDTAAALIVATIEVWTLLAYLVFALKVDFGPEIGYVMLTCVIGSLGGVAWGTLIGSLFRLKEGTKVGILIAANLTLSFLAGLMFVNMKDIVARKFPILSYINPQALITDALYSLYIYDSHHRFILNMGLLCLITLVFCITGFMKLRGEKYASL